MAIASELEMRLLWGDEIVDETLAVGFKDSYPGGISQWVSDRMAKAITIGDSTVLTYFVAGSRPLTSPMIKDMANFFGLYALIATTPGRVDAALQQTAIDYRVALEHMQNNKLFVEGSTEDNTLIQTTTVGSSSKYTTARMQGW